MDVNSFRMLIAQARLGDDKCMCQLTQEVLPRLRSYLLRITLDDELTNDVVQDTLLRMVKALGTLQNDDRFWPWLFKIANNQVKDVYRQRAKRKEVYLSAIEVDPVDSRNNRAGLPDDLLDSIKKVIHDGIRLLPLQQRSILSLRCFEDMPYTQIAQVVGCSETTARVVFFRAKQSLEKHLKRNGISKTMLMSALSVFGLLTAACEAAIPIKPVILHALSNVSLSTRVVGRLIRPAVAGVAAAVAAGLVLALAFFSAGPVPARNSLPAAVCRNDVRTVHFTVQGVRLANSPTAGSSSSSSSSSSSVPERQAGSFQTMGAYETWMHFPEGPDGPMLLRQQRWSIDGTQRWCTWLQDGKGNYYYHSGKHTVYLSNAPLRRPMLPTDSREFRKVVVRHYGMDRLQYDFDDSSGVLLRQVDNRVSSVPNYETLYEYNTVDLDTFRYSWSEDVKVVDERDEMHKRGWAYFRVTGRIGEETITGRGRVPFVYSAFKEHAPWLELRIGANRRIVDTPNGAFVFVGDVLKARHPAGSFHKGLGRPWMGYCVYDTLCRDAIDGRFAFRAFNHDGVGTVVVESSRAGPFSGITYDIDMERDVIRSLTFDLGGRDVPLIGEARIDYLQEAAGDEEEFRMPAMEGFSQVPIVDSPGIEWLFANLSAEGVTGITAN